MTIIILTHIHIHIQICILQYREREIVPLCPFRFRLVHLFRENLSIQASKLGGYLHSGSNERLLQPIIGTVWISSPAWSAHFPPFLWDLLAQASHCRLDIHEEPTNETSWNHWPSTLVYIHWYSYSFCLHCIFPINVDRFLTWRFRKNIPNHPN